MQKRDKYGRFLKGKVVKKKAKKAHPKKIAVYVGKRKAPTPKVADLSMYDLQDMIQAEVQFQMKEIW